MKVLLDACISESTIQPLREAGHDVEWVGSWNRDPGDREILEYAFRNRQILITLDKDFGELAIVHGVDHFGIVRIAPRWQNKPPFHARFWNGTESSCSAARSSPQKSRGCGSE